MPSLLEKTPTEKYPFEEVHSDIELQHDNVNLPRHRRKILLIVSLLLGSILIVVAALQNSDKTDEEHLVELQTKIENREALQDYEKKAYCDLLWKLKQVRLCACKKNFIKDIGSLTGYPIQSTDLDWRGSGKTFEEALQEAFKRTGVPLEKFKANRWAKDMNGKTGVVEWVGPRGSEVSVDAPHETWGPDVFHIGYQTSGKGDDQIKGHIFLDCVPYFRDSNKK